VRHLVKVSQLAADAHAVGRFQRYHAAVEKHILKSGIPCTFLFAKDYANSFVRKAAGRA
jgi:uncharacterized protein YbjT (DUF2867 family)